MGEISLHIFLSQGRTLGDRRAPGDLCTVIYAVDGVESDTKPVHLNLISGVAAGPYQPGAFSEITAAITEPSGCTGCVEVVGADGIWAKTVG